MGMTKPLTAEFKSKNTENNRYRKEIAMKAPEELIPIDMHAMKQVMKETLYHYRMNRKFADELIAHFGLWFENGGRRCISTQDLERRDLATTGHSATADITAAFLEVYRSELTEILAATDSKHVAYDHHKYAQLDRQQKDAKAMTIAIRDAHIHNIRDGTRERHSNHHNK